MDTIDQELTQQQQRIRRKEAKLERIRSTPAAELALLRMAAVGAGPGRTTTKTTELSMSAESLESVGGHQLKQEQQEEEEERQENLWLGPLVLPQQQQQQATAAADDDDHHQRSREITPALRLQYRRQVERSAAVEKQRLRSVEHPQPQPHTQWVDDYRAKDRLARQLYFQYRRQKMANTITLTTTTTTTTHSDPVREAYLARKRAERTMAGVKGL